MPNTRNRMPAREVVVVSGALLILAALLFTPHILHGGLYSDDWGDAARTLYPPGGPGFGNAIANMADFLSNCRPVLIVLLPLKTFAFGTHIKYLLALAVLLAVIVAILIYAVLRLLGVPWYHSCAVAALTIAYPWFDSTRFWESASPASLAIILFLTGLWIALVGLSRVSWRLHGCAALLYLMSILTYEITLPLVASAGLLYVFRVGWSRARVRWGMDLVAVVLGGLWSWAHTPRSVSSLTGDIHHLGEITTAGGELLGWSILPLGSQPHTALALGVLTLVLAGGVLAYLALPVMRAQGSDWGLRGWLLLALGGLLVAALGWAMFIPAVPYYTPSIYGETNRINALAGIGLIITSYAALGVIGTVFGELVKRRGLAAAITLALGLMLGVAYAHVLERHGRLWDAAFHSEMVAVDKLQTMYPDLPSGTTVFTSNYPASLTLGVPIFASTWDLRSLVKLRYEDGSLRAYPITSERILECRTNGVAVYGGSETVKAADYGTALLLDLSTGRHATPSNQGACQRLKARYPPGPLYLSTAY